MATARRKKKMENRDRKRMAKKKRKKKEKNGKRALPTTKQPPFNPISYLLFYPSLFLLVFSVLINRYEDGRSSVGPECSLIKSMVKVKDS